MTNIRTMLNTLRVPSGAESLDGGNGNIGGGGGGDPVGLHSQWRIAWPRFYGGDLTEIELLNASAVNIAPTATITTNSGYTGLTNLVDGNTLTPWSFGGPNIYDVELLFTFPSPVNITEVRFYQASGLPLFRSAFQGYDAGASLWKTYNVLVGTAGTTLNAWSSFTRGVAARADGNRDNALCMRLRNVRHSTSTAFPCQFNEWSVREFIAPGPNKINADGIFITTGAFPERLVDGLLGGSAFLSLNQNFGRADVGMLWETPPGPMGVMEIWQGLSSQRLSSPSQFIMEWTSDLSNWNTELTVEGPTAITWPATNFTSVTWGF